jgi:voltage-gated potassium channel Kch
VAFSHPGDRRRSLHGWVVRLVGGKDRYGVVLVLIVVLIVVLASGQEQTWTRPGGVGITSAVLLYTLATSGAQRRVFRGLLVALAVVAALSIGGAALFGRDNQSIEDAFMLLLVVVTQVVIARRLISHPYIDRSTVAGALCIYLLVGFCFSTIYRLLPALGFGPFFTTSHASTLDYLWFSYVTLTTVGYGDLIPRGGVGKMLAVTEALMGQIYLVTIVAVLVANIGRPRRSRSRTRAHPRQSTGRAGTPRSRARPPRARRRRSPLRS